MCYTLYNEKCALISGYSGGMIAAFCRERMTEMEKYVLGIDIGTTSVKTVLLSDDGKMAAEATRGHDLLSLHRNWAEERPDIWWSNAVETVREIGEKIPGCLEKVVCIGCSGMVPAIVMLDEQGEPVRNSIQQNDARAVEEIEAVTAALDQTKLYEQTGGTTNQQHIIPRLLWVKNHEPENWAKTRTIMGSYDYILYKLSGTTSLELNWAAESGCYDIHKRCWLSEQLDLFGIDPAWLPKVNDPMEVAAYTSAEMMEVMGLPAGIPIIGGSADHVASTLAAGIIDEGDLLIKFGGAGDILYCTKEPETSPQLFFDYHDVPGRSLINGCMASSGSLVKWLTHDVLRSEDPAILKKLDVEAAQLPPAADGVVVLPYFLGEKTPLFDPNARGIIFGLTLSHTHAHIFRAILESVIYGFKHHIEVIEKMGHRPQQIIATDGGAKSRLWCQIAADVLGQPVKAFPSHPGSALGVAFLAGMQAGLYSDWAEINRFLTEYQVYNPNPEATKVYEKAYQIYRGLYEQLQPAYQQVQALYND